MYSNIEKSVVIRMAENRRINRAADNRGTNSVADSRLVNGVIKTNRKCGWKPKDKHNRLVTVVHVNVADNEVVNVSIKKVLACAYEVSGKFLTFAFRKTSALRHPWLNLPNTASLHANFSSCCCCNSTSMF